MKKQDFGRYYKCGACEKAGLKEDWEKVGVVADKDVRVCPSCGCLIVVDIINVVTDPPVQEPKPEKPTGGKKK